MLLAEISCFQYIKNAEMPYATDSIPTHQTCKKKEEEECTVNLIFWICSAKISALQKCN